MDNVFIAYDAVLALYATGRQEGVVVDIGHRHAYAVPVVKGTQDTIYVCFFPNDDCQLAKTVCDGEMIAK